MRVRWTTDASDDLDHIGDYIAATNPVAGHGVAQTIIEGIETLRAFPKRGRTGRVEGTRELVLASLPFVVVYEVDDELRVLRILHGAQRWPPA